MEKQTKLTPREVKRKIRNQSAINIIKLFKEQYRGNINFPEVTEADVNELRKMMDECADKWLANIVNEK